MTSQSICFRIDTGDSQFLMGYVRDNNITGFDGKFMSVQMCVENIVHNFVLQERESKDDSNP